MLIGKNLTSASSALRMKPNCTLKSRRDLLTAEAVRYLSRPGTDERSLFPQVIGQIEGLHGVATINAFTRPYSLFGNSVVYKRA
jgi:hypothetical protein